MDLPVIYNSSGYERVETVQMLEEVVDVWLPDFKYMDSKLAFAYSRQRITRKLPGQQSGR